MLDSLEVKIKENESGTARTAHDPLALALSRLAAEHDLPNPGQLLNSLPCDDEGRICADQTENALKLTGLDHVMISGQRLPNKSTDFPALVQLGGGNVAILYERSRGQFLAWMPGDEDALWIDRANVERDFTGEAFRIFPHSEKIRSEGGNWKKTVEDNWFWKELTNMRQDFRPVLGAALLINLLALAMPLFTMNVYDRIIPNRAVSSLWVLAIGVFLAFGIEFALKLARANLLDELGRKLDLKLSEKIFAKLINISLADRAGDTGKLARRVSEFETVRDFFASTTILLIVDLLFVFLFVSVIAFLAGWLALVPVCIIAMMIIAGMILQRKMTAATVDAQIDSGLQHSLLVEAIGGAETLKACNAESRIVGRWRNLYRLSSQTQEQLRRLNSTAVNLAGLCQQMTSISLIIGGFYLFDAGKISMGAIIAIVMLAGRSLAPAGQIAFLFTRGRQSITILNSLGTLMSIEDERGFGSQSVVPEVRAGSIKMMNVSFAYPNMKLNAISDVSLQIKPGEKIAIIGRVASGKSTLGRLICGLYFPNDGSVMVDGLDNRQYRPAELRSQFRFVGQDAELFSGSIKENLLMGAPSADDQALIDALIRVGANEHLGGDEGGFERVTGERGRNLSGGQRSFLVLARAMASPSKLLFLDEPTGSMDMRTERFFVEKLSAALAENQTLIISTHRQAVLSLCDRLIIMDAGRILADGPREKIMAQTLEREGSA